MLALSISLAEDAGLPHDDREIGRRQQLKPEDERGSLGGERAAIGFTDLLRRHRQEADLEQEPSRRRGIEQLGALVVQAKGQG